MVAIVIRTICSYNGTYIYSDGRKNLVVACVTTHENCTPKWALITGLCAWHLPYYIKPSREKIFADQWEGREFGTGMPKISWRQL